jgi:CsoR family transcriptional regulator, copper-sensing transcriptional repressor
MKRRPPVPASETTNCQYLSPGHAKDLRDSLSRIEGHVGGIKRMIEQRRCADDLLTQLAAVRAGLNSVAIKIVEEELQSCLSLCEPLEAEDRFHNAMRAMASMLKHG